MLFYFLIQNLYFLVMKRYRYKPIYRIEKLYRYHIEYKFNYRYIALNKKFENFYLFFLLEHVFSQRKKNG